MFEISDLLALVDRYRAATGVEDTTVSNRVFGDTKKIAALRGGADITTGRFKGAIAWFSVNWPDGAEWPSSIPRPEAAAAPEAAE